MLTGKRIPRVIEMNVEGHLLITKQKIRYLGVEVDNCRRFGAHSEIVCGKADAIMGALRSLLPNVNGSTGSMRKLHYGTW